MLDAADAVRDLGEVPESQFLLVLEAERAMIGADHGQLVHAQTLPEIALMSMTHLADVMRIIVSRPQRRAADPLGPLEARLTQGLLESQPQILRTGFGEDVATVMSRCGHLVQRVPSGHVHDVQRHIAGHMRQHDGPMRGFGFER